MQINVLEHPPMDGRVYIAPRVRSGKPVLGSDIVRLIAGAQDVEVTCAKNLIQKLEPVLEHYGYSAAMVPVEDQQSGRFFLKRFEPVGGMKRRRR